MWTRNALVAKQLLGTQKVHFRIDVAFGRHNDTANPICLETTILQEPVAVKYIDSPDGFHHLGQVLPIGEAIGGVRARKPIDGLFGPGAAFSVAQRCVEGGLILRKRSRPLTPEF